MIDTETGEIVGAEKVSPHIRTRYNYDMDRVTQFTGLSCGEPTRTQQQFKDEVDINTIVHRFGLTGELPENVRVPQSGDFTNVTDYQTAMNLVVQAREAFMELPAEVRYRFHNDPQELQRFVENKDNLEEARKLGIAVPAPTPVPPPEPMPVRVVSDPPAQSST